jgi:hypothetical protein
VIAPKSWQQLADLNEDESIRRWREGGWEKSVVAGKPSLPIASRRGLGLGVALGVALWALLFLVGRLIAWLVAG